ncbi:MAG: M18 family aminopeptidase [Actinobacteria bacterium]|nr:M18 family aminopeptidase [Actinomycetota bacterium]
MDTDATHQAADLCTFIDASPSPFHAVATAAARLEAAGFIEGSPGDGAGARYLRSSGSLVAWIAGHGRTTGFRVLMAHTDSPNLRITPNPDRSAHGVQQLGIEVYGGALLNSWLDRDLGCSGRLAVRDGDGHRELLVRLDRPIARVPQLAIHLDRGVNTKGLVLDPHTNLSPVTGLGDLEHGAFLATIAATAGVDAADVLGFDLMLHDLAPSTLAGTGDEFVSASRIDNLLSCHAAVGAICGIVDEAGGPTPVIVLYDHEEVGSTSATGAGSPVLSSLLEQLLGDASLKPADSLACSVDGAHAVHPNYPDRHDAEHLVHLGGGPVLKFNASQRYATDAPGAARVRLAAERCEVPLQSYSHRADLPCGSTVGPITAAATGLPTVDLGAPQLAMHSARELCAVGDVPLLGRLLEELLRS